MTYLEQINKIASQLPLPVLQDINQRVGDWIATGGNENDPYIGQQLRFAENVLKRAAGTR
ncbi:hypothetical protein ACEOWJ_002022 [Bacillus cereus]|uniref:DUF6877 family protein n=1 Tax=Bacillus sp. UNC322MFChir4.1 TaxID=1449045 RepID=UPI0005584C22|nr:DUF6877 family protein [Bacillus sp. UNC322MFChir4.1]